MSTYMVSINISIKKEAYEFLKNIKTGDKSFSDIILGFKKKENDIMKFFGVLKDANWNAGEKDMETFRKSFNKRLQ